MWMQEYRFDSYVEDKRVKVVDEDKNVRFTLHHKFPEEWVFEIIKIANKAYEDGKNNGSIEKITEINEALDGLLTIG